MLIDYARPPDASSRSWHAARMQALSSAALSKLAGVNDSFFEIGSHLLQLPLYESSIWTVPYLLARGLPLLQILNFPRFANTASHAQLRGERFDLDEAVSNLLELPDWRWPAPPHRQPAQMAWQAGLQAGL